MILVKTFYANNDLRNFSYLITDDKSGECWVIDPYDAKPLINDIKNSGLILRGILNTHQHFDHILGNKELLDTFGGQITKLKGSEKITLSDSNEIHSLDTPGHTMDHQVFIWQEKGRPVALFAGDTLFNAGVGNCKGGGNVDYLYDSTEMLLKSLPIETLLYPGHDYVLKNLEFALNCEPHNPVIKERFKEIENEPVERRKVFSLKEELEVNPFLRLDAPEIKQTVMAADARKLFHKLRSMRDQW